MSLRKQWDFFIFRFVMALHRVMKTKLSCECKKMLVYYHHYWQWDNHSFEKSRARHLDAKHISTRWNVKLLIFILFCLNISFALRWIKKAFSNSYWFLLIAVIHSRLSSQGKKKVTHETPFICVMSLSTAIDWHKGKSCRGS